MPQPLPFSQLRLKSENPQKSFYASALYILKHSQTPEVNILSKQSAGNKW
jgi:hypothetical protein